MYKECALHKGCVVEWSDGTYSLFNGFCNLVGICRTRPNLVGLTEHTIEGVKFSRKRKALRVYYIPKVTTQEVLHNNFVGVKNDNFEGFSREERETERHDSSVDARNVGV